jgi:hypothetical protein
MSLEARWPFLRDVAAFLIGGYGVLDGIHQSPKDLPSLVFYGCLMGVPGIAGVLGKGKP